MSIQRRKAMGLIGATATGLWTGPGGGSQAADGKPHPAARAGQQEFFAPVEGMHLYLCGFHTGKANPEFQIEVQHYCHVGQDLHQCVIFDRTEKQAKLLGVEYIITDQLYSRLPDDEQKYWHPHTYEVLSGQLAAPGIPVEDEQKLMKQLIRTWGKTWHTWPDPSTKLPVGDPLLMWAVTGDGQLEPGRIRQRDDRLNVSTARSREQRTAAFNLPVPQVPQPESVDFIGRQWTAEGPDTPQELRQRSR